MTLSCVESEPYQPAKQTLIWLHGLGADGNDFASLATELHPAITTITRFILPNAPMRPVTFNMGYIMRAWFDIEAIAHDARIDREGVMQSVAEIEKLIAIEEEKGITARNIFLGGFSQGAAIALLAGLLREKNTIGGILALSSYLPPDAEIKEKIHSLKNHPPIFLAHGTLDNVVPYALGENTYAWLKQNGCVIDWHTYPIAHSVCKEELDDISTWLIKNK